ncbi:sulfatase [Saltatorellus ferox]
MGHHSLRSLLTILVGAVCALLGTPAGAQAGEESPTRVLLVDLDDVGHLLMDAARTPNLDALAETGRYFPTFVASPSCSPSRAMLLMGAQTSHPDILLGRVLLEESKERTAYQLEPPTLTSLSSLVLGAGGSTAKIGKWHLGMPEEPEHPIRLGFETYAGVMGNLNEDGVSYHRFPKIIEGAMELVEGRYLTTDETDDGIAALERGTDLVSLSYHACHGPWAVPPLELLSPETRAELVALGGPDEWLKLEPAALAPLMLEALDRELGRLFAQARGKGYTVFVFGDNGSSGFVGGGKKSFADSGVVAPLWVFGPGVEPGTDPALVSICDVYATVAELMGIERQPETQGPQSLSFVPALRGEPHTRRFAVAEIFGRIGDSPRERKRMRWTRMLRGERFKLVWNRKDGEDWSLFDLVADPDEDHDLIAEGELGDEAQLAYDEMRAVMEAEVAGSGREVVSGQRAEASEDAPAEAGDDRPTKVLLIDLDDVGHGMIAEARTPTLDGLAARGRFYTTLVTAPTCSPSRAMLQTGAWCSDPNVLLGRVLRNKYKGSQAYELPTKPLQTLASFVAASGRSTAKVGKWHLSQASATAHPNECGWQSYRGVISNLIVASDTYESYPKVVDGKEQRLEGRYITSDETDDAIAAVEQGVDLVSVSYHAPHKPWHVPPAELLAPRFDGEGKPLEISAEGLSNEEMTLLMLEACDHELGRLLEAAEARGYTVFVFGDNGGQNSREEEGGKGTFLESGIVVPMWAVGPGIEPGVDRSLLSMVDFYATIAELFGLERDPKTQGPDSFSFARTFGGEMIGPRYWAYSETFDVLGEDPRKRISIQWQRAVRGRRYKLFQNRGAGFFTLVDLEEDPEEKVNLLDKLPLSGEADEAHKALLQILYSI